MLTRSLPPRPDWHPLTWDAGRWRLVYLRELRAGRHVWVENPQGPVEGCFATSPNNLVALWEEGYRPCLP